jgi:hypothetical protein
VSNDEISGYLELRNKGLQAALGFRQEAPMEHRKVRNEFGLDEYNAMDVRKERMKRQMPWLLGALAIFAVLGMLIYWMTDRDTQSALIPVPPQSTSGSASAPAPAPAPPSPAPQR